MDKALTDICLVGVSIYEAHRMLISNKPKVFSCLLKWVKKHPPFSPIHWLPAGNTGFSVRRQSTPSISPYMGGEK